MRPQVLYPLFSDLSSLKGVGGRISKLLEKLLDSDKIANLLWHLPSGYIDRSYSPNIIDAPDNRIITLKVTVGKHLPPHNRTSPYRIECYDDTGFITLTFFKVKGDYVKNLLPEGSQRIISGKVESFNNKLQMSHPDYVVQTERINEVLGFETIYPLTAGISNKVLSKIQKQALDKAPELDEWIDASLLKQKGWDNWHNSLISAHEPKSEADLSPANKFRSRLAYDELLAGQLALAIVRQKYKKTKGRSIKGDGKLRHKLLEHLPFALTSAQKRVLAEIGEDMASETKMLRLLQGDVGSGKTIVALLTMLNAIECGAQSAIMAPTDILSRQHFETISTLADKIGVRTAILTGRTKGKKREELLSELKDGKIDILIGTHALFQDDVTFKDLACVIIDEQHRFGVQQRLDLSAKGNLADVLVMTATPIPRTLTLTAYGDMDCSRIDELPPGRQKIDTLAMPKSKMTSIIDGVKRALSTGTKVYWVCPLVEESEKLDLAAAEERYEHLHKIFGDKVGLVHGKMKGADKDKIMEDFAFGSTDLLIATTVIEVGVNVPQATIMVIEHAERFGLSQLHQLRGRIGRGSDKSTCILLYSPPLSETAQTRLKTIRETEDGFIIAEEDLKLRGAGELLGTRQSGLPEFKLADLSMHGDLIAIARKDAELIMSKDANLTSERGKNLRTLLYLFEKDQVANTLRSG